MGNSVEKKMPRKTIYVLLQEKGYTREEIDAALKLFLFPYEVEMLHDFYPLGLDCSLSKYDLLCLKRKPMRRYDVALWMVVEQLLEVHEDFIKKVTNTLEPSIDTMSEEEAKLADILIPLKEYYEGAQVCFDDASLSENFNFSFVQEKVKVLLIKIFGEEKINAMPVDYNEMHKAENADAGRLERLVNLIADVISNCEKGLELQRVDIKGGCIKHIYHYDRELYRKPYLERMKQETERKSIAKKIEKHQSLDINNVDLPLFRRVLLESPFMEFAEEQDSYDILTLWINPNASDVLSNPISVQSISGEIKSQIAQAKDDYEVDYLLSEVGSFTEHRPATIQYLVLKTAAKVTSIDGEIPKENYYDKCFTLFGVMTEDEVKRLAPLERRFVTLKFGLHGKFYSCESIAKHLGVDVNLIQNLYAKYLRKILEKMQFYVDSYVDMEVEKQAVLKK